MKVGVPALGPRDAADDALEQHGVVGGGRRIAGMMQVDLELADAHLGDDGAHRHVLRARGILRAQGSNRRSPRASAPRDWSAAERRPVRRDDRRADAVRPARACHRSDRTRIRRRRSGRGRQTRAVDHAGEDWRGSVQSGSPVAARVMSSITCAVGCAAQGIGFKLSRVGPSLGVRIAIVPADAARAIAEMAGVEHIGRRRKAHARAIEASISSDRHALAEADSRSGRA